VVGISDGDTLAVMQNGRAVRIRLDGIDAPEAGQDFTNAAKQFLSDLVFDQTVTVSVKERDRYDRLVSRVQINGRDVSLAMVEGGFAWHYVPLLPTMNRWPRPSETPGPRAVALWTRANPIPPWEFRATPAAATTQAPSAGPYHGNVRSHVFHKPSCRYYNCKNCTAVFQTREAAIAAGYRPGGICKP
jgi:endonuclease YncB( thermonuclease family)